MDIIIDELSKGNIDLQQLVGDFSNQLLLSENRDIENNKKWNEKLEQIKNTTYPSDVVAQLEGEIKNLKKQTLLLDAFHNLNLNNYPHKPVKKGEVDTEIIEKVLLFDPKTKLFYVKYVFDTIDNGRWLTQEEIGDLCNEFFSSLNKDNQYKLSISSNDTMVFTPRDVRNLAAFNGHVYYQIAHNLCTNNICYETGIVTWEPFSRENEKIICL